MNQKQIIRSKTIWAAAIATALISFEGPVNEWFAKNPSLGGAGLCALFTFLRLVTTSGLFFR